MTMMIEVHMMMIMMMIMLFFCFCFFPLKLCIEQIQRFPFLHPIRKLFDYAYNQPTPLHLYDKDGKLHDTLTSAVGVRQGDVLSSLLFSLAMQPIYENIVDKHNVKAVAVIDDFTLIGEADNIFAALLDFQKQLTNIKLELVLSKCQLLAPPAANKTVQQNIQQQCNNIGIIYNQDNIELLGTIISHNKQQIQRVRQRQTQRTSDRILRLLGNPQMHKHVALQLLIETVVPTLGYLAQTIDPDDLLEAAIKFDKNILNTFCTITGIDTLLLPDYKKNQITLPLKKGGYGLQKTARTSPAAYFAILCLILDDVTKEYGPEAAAPIHLRLNSLIDHELKNLGITKHELANLKSNVNLNHILNSPLSRKQSTTEHTQSQPITKPQPKDTANDHQIRHKVKKTKSQDEEYTGTQREIATRTAADRRKNHRSEGNRKPPSLQHQLTQIINKHNADQLRQQLKDKNLTYDLAALTDVCENNANSWVLLDQTNERFRLQNRDVEIAVKNHLGLHFHNGLQGQVCTCGSKFDQDPQHFLSCSTTLGEHIIARHDNIKYAIAAAVKDGSNQYPCETKIEPSNLQHDVMDPQGLRPDLQINTITKPSIIDVTVVNTTNKSNMALYEKNINNLCKEHKIQIPFTSRNDPSGEEKISTLVIKQGIAIHKAEQAKIKKYTNMCKKNGMHFSPIVITTRGTIGYHTKRFIEYFKREQATTFSDSTISQTFNNYITIALIKGNTQIVNAGIAKFNKLNGAHALEQGYISTDEETSTDTETELSNSTSSSDSESSSESESVTSFEYTRELLLHQAAVCSQHTLA